MSDLLPRLYSIVLRYTENEPIKGKDLASKLNISERELRKLVNEAIKQHMRIGSLGAGYFYIANATEAERIYLRLRKHSLSQLAHANAVKRLFKSIKQQELELA